MSDFTPLQRALHKIKERCTIEFYDKVIAEVNALQSENATLHTAVKDLCDALKYMLDKNKPPLMFDAKLSQAQATLKKCRQLIEEKS